MVSRREKLVKRLLSSLNVDKNPSGRPGRLIREGTKIHSKKDRKSKGHVEARLIHPQMKWEEVREEGIEPEKFWDDWVERRDGMRHNTNSDQLYHKWRGCCGNRDLVYEQNNKLVRQIRIRKSKLNKKNLKEYSDDALSVTTIE